MNAITTTLLALTCMLAGVFIGSVLRKTSPENHRVGESRDAIRSGLAVIGTLAALVLGLMVSSASRNFETLNGGLTENAASYIDLDRILAQYGAGSGPSRDLLKQAVAAEIDHIWPKGGTEVPSMSYSVEFEAVAGSLRELRPESESQKILKPRAMQVMGEALKQRWLVVAHAHTSVPTAFVVIVVFWFAVLFAVFTLLAPSNATANSFMVFCTVAVAGGVFLVLDMSQPFDGLIRISREPMETALGLMGH